MPQARDRSGYKDPEAKMKFSLSKELRVKDACEALGLRFRGEDQLITSVGNLSVLEPGVIGFSVKVLPSVIDGIVIAPKEQEARTLIFSERPRWDFCRLSSWLEADGYLQQSRVPSKIHDSCEIAESAIIEPNVTIGENSKISSNVVIRSNTEIGSNCIIRENTVIGAEGFGFEQGPEGSWIRFPHLGGVKIGDNVELGALNSVCRGALGDTLIGHGVKTDNLVHIAHNCILGNHCVVTACAEFSGGVRLGDRVWVGPNCSLMEKIEIGDDSLVGLGSVVLKSLPANVIAAGSPAKIIRER